MMIESLIPMQNTLREAGQLPEMVDFVRSGGIFTAETLSVFATQKREDAVNLFKLNPIKVVRFEDGAMYLHDGLHRATAIWMAGRRVLDPREFVLESWEYKDYLEINLDQKWYTPFHPRKEVRINDFLSYKRLVEEFITKEPKPTNEEIRLYILDHYEVQSYTEPRSVKSVAEVASRYTTAIPTVVE